LAVGLEGASFSGTVLSGTLSLMSREALSPSATCWGFF
jgi:hypothetical protein